MAARDPDSDVAAAGTAAGAAAILDGYRDFELLHAGRRPVYRCRRVGGKANETVVVKIRPETALRDKTKDDVLDREYAFAQELANVPGVVHALEYKKTDKQCGLVFEDLQAESLGEYLGHIRDGTVSGEFPFTRRLEIALAVATTLDVIHQRDILHLDIKPGNVLVNTTTWDVKVGDFGTAIHGTMASASFLIGTPAYVAPELTGRTTGSVDRRSDLYSFGVMLYEIFTLRLPFECLTAAEFIQAHIARVPIPPRTILPSLPAPIEAIIMKLLCKDKEKRYESAYGLKLDLRRCLDELRASGRISPFDLGVHDRSAVLRAPRRLWGRGGDLERMDECLARTRAGARTAAVLDGAPGIGKSALVEEFRRRASAEHYKRLLFATGKADQTRRVPYAVLAQAVGDMVMSVQMDGPKQVAQCREQLRHTLGKDLDILTSVLPTLQLLFGTPEHDVLVDNEHTHARFSLAMVHLCRYFATPEHPLVMYIDDIQWIDETTIRVLDALLNDERLHNLMVVCIYRTHELPIALQTLMGSLESFKKALTISISGLDAASVAELIVDVTGCSREDAAPLAEISTKRTDGNPLHVMEVLRFLQSHNLLRFDANTRTFTWDLATVRGRINSTGDVAEMVSRRVATLAEDVAAVLSVAASIGQTFSSVLLQEATRLSHDAVRAALSTAWDAGMIERFSGVTSVSVGDSTVERDGATEAVSEELFAFLHDKIHEAAFKLLPERRAATHIRLAEILLARSADRPQLRTKWTFEICGHLNFAADHGAVLSAELLDVAVRLNYDAALASHKMVAFAASMEHLRRAKRHLAHRAALAEAPAAVSSDSTPPHADNEALEAERMWSFNHTVAMQLTLEELSLCLQAEDMPGAARATEEGMTHAQTAIEKAKLIKARVYAGVSKDKSVDVLKLGREALTLLGYPLPADQPAEFAKALEDKYGFNKRGKAAPLVDLPLATDDLSLVLSDLISGFMWVIYLADSTYFPAICALAFQVAIERGMVAALAAPMAMYCAALVDKNEFDVAADMSEVVRTMVVKHGFNAAAPQVLVSLGATVTPWKKPFGEAYEVLTQANKFGMDVGDYNFVGYGVLHRHYIKFVEGGPLGNMVRELPDNLQFVRSSKNALAQGSLTVTLRACAKLMQSERFIHVIADSGEKVIEDEEEFMKSIAPLPYCTTAYLIMISLYYIIYDCPAEALPCLAKAESMVGNIGGLVLQILIPFLESMATLRLCEGTLSPEQDTRMRANLKRIESWAIACPANYRPMFLLVEAELLRVQGAEESHVVSRLSEAVSLGSQRNSFCIVALAHETAARYWASSKIGQFCIEYRETHIKQAIAAYRAYGAQAKAELLRTKPLEYSASRPLAPGESRVTRTLTLEGNISEELDALFLLKASQAISSELRPDRLFDIALPILMESSGAEHACLLTLTDDDTFVVEATASEAEGRENAKGVPPFASLIAGARVDASSILLPLVNLVAGTMEPRIITDAVRDVGLWNDPYVQAHKPRSVLCAGLTSRGKLSKILYMENNQYPGTFTQRRLTFVKVLLNQAAISWENARLYAQFEESTRTLAGKVVERTAAVSAAMAVATTARESVSMVAQAKTASLATMAHDLRTPMNAVVSLAALLLGTRLSDDQRENVRIIKTSGEALCRQVDSILEVSKLEAAKVRLDMMPADLRACIRDCCLILKVKAEERKLRLDLLIDDSVPQVIVGDALRLRQIVINLLGNAIKFTDSGQIDIEMNATPLPAPGRLESVHWAPDIPSPEELPWYELQVVVRDTGIGISAEGVSKLFQPFEQVDQSAERRQLGTGLGLVISKNLCELMGGRMWVESKEGIGSSFHFSFICPALPDARAEDLAVLEGAIETATVDLKILIVDDHHINQKVLVKMLGRLGYKADVASSGLEALASVQQANLGQPYDVIFMDIHMPGMDGVEVTRRLRADLPVDKQPRIIALTAEILVDDSAMLGGGFNDYLAKPVKLTDLMGSLRVVQPLTRNQK